MGQQLRGELHSTLVTADTKWRRRNRGCGNQLLIECDLFFNTDPLLLIIFWNLAEMGLLLLWITPPSASHGMCPRQTAFSYQVGFKIRVPGCGENFHRQLVCLSQGTDQNVTIKERLDVFSRLPVFPWISIKRCERSHFPPSLLLPQAVTNRQIRAQSVRSGFACRKGMLVALWTYTLYAQTWFAVYMAAEQRSRCGSGTSSCALTRVQSGNRNLDTKTKDGGVSKEQNETRMDGSSRSPAAATGFMVFCMRALHLPSVSWATKARLQPPPPPHTTHFKAKR